jgi:hypothetical protein
MTVTGTILSALSVALVASTGCRLKASAWVVSGSRSERLVIGVAQERGSRIPVEDLDEFTITTCPSDRASRQDVWTITATATLRTIPTAIRYGVVPSGFKGPSAAPTLSPGCYEAFVIGTGIAASSRFDVHEDGAVVEATR